jgi:hypothetical protein
MLICYYLDMKKFLFLCPIFAFILASSQTSTTLGCAIHPGDRWFSVKPEITSNPLSGVLGISFSENGSLITFTNRGLNSDLYIASKDTDGKYPGYDRTRKDYRPTEGIIGHDFDPNVLIAVKNGLPKGVYTFYGGWDKDNNFSDTDNENSGTAVLDRVLDSTDNYKIKQIVGDNRPNDTLAPESDHQTMYAFYQGKRYDIGLTLHYTLNESYDPHKTANSCAGESEALQMSIANAKKENSNWLKSSIILGAVSITFVAFLLTPWLYSRSAKKKQSKQSPSKRKMRK